MTLNIVSHKFNNIYRVTLNVTLLRVSGTSSSCSIIRLYISFHISSPSSSHATLSATVTFVSRHQVVSSHLTISLPISHVHSIGAKIYCYRRPARQFKSVSVSSSNCAVPTDSILLPLSFMPTTVVTTSASHRSPDLLPECTDAVAGVT